MRVPPGTKISHNSKDEFCGHSLRGVDANSFVGHHDDEINAGRRSLPDEVADRICPTTGT